MKGRSFAAACGALARASDGPEAGRRTAECCVDLGLAETLLVAP
jgi:hypothetical protein